MSDLMIESWHAHLYFDPPEKSAIETLTERVRSAFPDVEIGRVHERPVGPHPRGSCQLAFGPALFGTLVPWLVLERGGLTVFLHPNTGETVPDHRDRAVWIGPSEPLNLDALG